MKDFERHFKHIFNPPMKRLIDSTKPFQELQERNKLLFGINSGLNEIVRNALEPYSVLKISPVTTPRIELSKINTFKTLNENLAFNFNYVNKFLKRNSEFSELFQSTLLDKFKTKIY